MVDSELRKILWFDHVCVSTCHTELVSTCQDCMSLQALTHKITVARRI